MVKEMLAYLKHKKEELAKPNRNAWHAKLTRFALGKYPTRIKKACPYYWLIVPSVPIAGVKALFFLAMLTVAALTFMVFCAAYTPTVAICWFFGWRPVDWTVLHRVFRSKNRPKQAATKAKDDDAEATDAPHVPSWEDIFWPYKHKLVGDHWAYPAELKQVRFAPYQIILPPVGLALVVWGLVALHNSVSSIGNAGSSVGGFFGDHYEFMLLIMGGITVVCAFGYLYSRIIVPLLKRAYQRWCPPLTWVDDAPEEQAPPDGAVAAS